MIRKIFLQQPDITIMDFSNGKTLKLNAMTLKGLQDTYEDKLKNIKILPKLIDKELVWGVKGPAIRVLEITNVFQDGDNYCLETEGVEREITISLGELKTLLFGLVEK